MRSDSEIFYDLLEEFFSAMLVFEEQRDEYEHAVLTLAAREGVDRRDLRLAANELASLLDFKRLTHLRDRYLLPLRQHSHQLFGGNDRDILDIMISDIFHLVSILKEEEFRVSHYAVLYDKMSRSADRDYILDAVHHDFPLLLDQTHGLFLQAKEVLESHAASYGDCPVVARSVYLFGAPYLDVVYREEGGVSGFYRHLYPKGGPLEAFLIVARSFHAGGFTREAAEALQRARSALHEHASEKLRNDLFELEHALA